MKARMHRLGIIVLAALCAGGCAISRKTSTKRAATEQLLLSCSVDRAVECLDFKRFAGKKVFLDGSKLKSEDQDYFIEIIRARVLEAGVVVTPTAKGAEFIFTALSGALGTDSSEFLIGLPSLPIIIPGAGGLSTPELALFKIATQEATAKVRVFATGGVTKSRVLAKTELGRKHIASTYAFGKAYFQDWVILFVPFSVTDIPEKNTRILWKEQKRKEDEEANKEVEAG